MYAEGDLTADTNHMEFPALKAELSKKNCVAISP